MISIDDYRRHDATGLAGLVRAGLVTGDELAAAADSLLQAYSALNALADRAAAVPVPDEGPFAGVPFAVKELLAWPGTPWTMGSRLMANQRVPDFSPYAARIRDCGLRVLGSSTSSEFGLLGSTESTLRGPTLNPWGAGLSAGGSSGGSAALVAAGIVPMAHGNDAGGSLRVPAALNGLFGFKPSNGRPAPSGPDAGGFPSLVVDHCISRTVRDSARFLAATERTGADAVHRPVGFVADASPQRRRIGVLTPTLLGEAPDDAVAGELKRVADLCAALGHDVVELVPPAVDGAAVSTAFFTSAALTLAQVAALVTPMLGRAPGPDELEPFTLELIRRAATSGPTAAEDSARALHRAGADYLTAFERCEIVLSPTLARVSWPLGHLSPELDRATLVERTGQAVGYTPIHNAAGCPAMSVPLGQHDGRPVGLHFAARPGADDVLLALAYELEAAAPWAGTRPDTAWLGPAA